MSEEKKFREWDIKHFRYNKYIQIEALKAERAKSKKLVGALEWLTLSHDVDTSTKQRSDYWANQFKIAIKLARKALKDYEASDE